MKALSHPEILQELTGLMTGHWITDLANTAALLFQNVQDINWVGFYLYEVEPVDPAQSQNMWLGPFQGLPACTMIPNGKGVCGTSAATKKTMRVDDVDAFPGHIVCDSRSKSELVVPLIMNETVVGVLDVDSASASRFTQSDQVFFESVVHLLLNANSRIPILRPSPT